MYKTAAKKDLISKLESKIQGQNLHQILWIN